MSETAMSQPVDRPFSQSHFRSSAFLFGWGPLVIGLLLSISLVIIASDAYRNVASSITALILPFYLIMAIVWAFRRRWNRKAIDQSRHQTTGIRACAAC